MSADGAGAGRVRVVLVDDDPLVRAGVATILASDEGLEVVGEGSDGREAVELARRHRPDVVLLDVRMPGVDGLTALPDIRSVLPEAGVIILTTFSEGDYVSRAVAGGASGFVLKAGAPRELILGVHSVAEGGAYFSPSIARWLLEQTTRRDLDRGARAREQVAALSPRHTEVLDLVARGLSNAQIGRSLQLVEGTVKAYVSAILTQLDLENRVQAAILGHEAGLGREERDG